MSVESFPSEEIKQLLETPNISVDKNTVIYQCPYSKVILPAYQTTISIGESENRICFDPKYIDFLTSCITKSITNGENVTDYIRYIDSISFTCVGCNKVEASGFDIDSIYYIGGNITERTLADEGAAQELMFQSQKQKETNSLCESCASKLANAVPSVEMYSIITMRSI